MKKTARGLALMGVALLSLSVPLVGQAAGKPSVGSSSSSSTPPTSPKPDDATTGNTSVTVGFSEGNQPVTPVDPSNPNQQLGNDNSTIPGNGVDGKHDNKGLALIYVPHDFDFGSHNIDAFNQQIFSVNKLDVLEPQNNESHVWNGKGKMIIEVSDQRGTDVGWNLKVHGGQLKWDPDNRADEQTNNDVTIIKGATLSFPKGDVTFSGDPQDKDADYHHAWRDAQPLEINSDQNILTGNAEDSAPILNAEQNHGRGMTVDALDPAGIKLTIPANTARKGNYETQLTWTLNNTPNS